MSDKYMVWKQPQISQEQFGGGVWVRGSFPCNKELAEAQAQKLAAHGFNTKVEEYVPEATKPPVTNAELPLPDNDGDPEVKFTEFHAKNPKVYAAMVKMALELKAKGHNKIGMQMLIEVIRWRSMLETTDLDYKINNNYGARYARLIMAENPELDGIFELRKSLADV